MITSKRIVVALLAVVLFFVIHITLVTSQTGLTSQAIYQDVWDKVNHRLMGTPWAGAQGANISYTETEILRDVYDAVNHYLRTSGSGGGGGTWGTITGTLSTQTDLQTALDAKVPITRSVAGHALSGDVTVSKSDVGLGNVDNTSDATKNSATKTLTNTEVAPRVPTPCTPVANVITPNADSMDVCEYYTLVAAVTIANPSHTGSHPYDQQVLIIELSGAAAQVITAFGTDYDNSCGINLPTGITGSNIVNRFIFRYSTTSTKWCLSGSTKGDDWRVTTLASSTTFTPPADTADIVEMAMTATSGTLTVAAPTPFGITNGKFLRLSFLCTNSQTFSWNAIYISGPSFTLPSTCPADVTKWTIVEVVYSTVLSKWQAIRSDVAGSVPANVVKNDQSNTYSTGTQSFASATAVIEKTGAAYAPTVNGSVGYDTTQNKYVHGDNGITGAMPSIVCVGDGGSTNDASSGSGSFVDHTPTCTIPASWLLFHKQVDICTMWRYTTGSAAPTITFQFKFGSTVIFSHVAQTPQNNKTNFTYGFCFWVIARAAPGAAANVSTGLYAAIDSICCVDNVNNTAQPVALPTNASNAFAASTKWTTAGTGTSTITLEGIRATSYN